MMHLALSSITTPEQPSLCSTIREQKSQVSAQLPDIKSSLESSRPLTTHLVPQITSTKQAAHGCWADSLRDTVASPSPIHLS